MRKQDSEGWKKVADPETKRHIIGDCFFEVRKKEIDLRLERENWMLGQGTIYPILLNLVTEN